MSVQRLLQRPVVLGAALGILAGFGAGGAWGMLVSAEKAAAPIPVYTLGRWPPPSSPSPSPSASPSPSPSPSVSRPAEGVAGGPSGRVCGAAQGRLVRWRVLVEPGLATTTAAYARGIESVLCDPRSWIASGRVRFQYDPAGRLLLGLRTPDSSEARCLRLVGKSVRRYYSCASSREIVLNADRWFGGSDHWPGAVGEYRRMLVNHEVGHAIGQRHRSCGATGAPAPVMMQQSKGVGGCRTNPWPLGYELRTV